MYVACPSCKALYTISVAQLQIAAGKVRCSRCRAAFDANLAVCDDPRQALAFEAPLEDQVLREIDALVDRALDQVPDTSGVPSDDAVGKTTVLPAHVAPDVAAPDVAAPDVAEVPAEPHGLWVDRDCYAQPVTNEFVPGDAGESPLSDISPALLLDDETGRARRPGWGMVAAVMVLTLALVAQYAWWDRNRLAQSAALRPTLDRVCNWIGCDLPLRRDLSRVKMVGREVRNDPPDSDALMVSAAFINSAPFVQAYPVLQLSFSDVAGTLVAVRRFAPKEYLHDKNPAEGMAPGEQTLVMLEIVDPGTRAVSFQFDFM